MPQEKRKYPGPERAPYRNGNLEEWPGYGFGDSEVQSAWGAEWRQNEPFRAALILTGIERGRSAMRFMWRCEKTGASYPMFAIDMAALAMSRSGVTRGRAEGAWIVMKRGAHYGIARYEG